MKKSISLVITLSLSVLMLPVGAIAEPAAIEPSFVEGEVLVSFAEDPTVASEIEVNALTPSGADPELTPQKIMAARLNAGERGFTVEPVILSVDEGISTHSFAEGVQTEPLAFGFVKDPTRSTAELIQLIGDDPDIAYVQPNFLYEIIEPAVEEELSFPQQALNNFESASRLYGIYNNAQNAGVRADSAWAQGFTGRGVVIADLDTGVDLTHPDLRPNLWRNPGETNCSNRIDDDKNGFADDCTGWDFASNDNDPSPAHPHGSHTSGTFGAARNGFGVVGVAPEARIMPIKIGTATNIPLLNALFAIEYAVRNGADIINLSLGSNNACTRAESDAVQWARGAGVFVVASSGNRGANIPNSPANCPTVFGVGATDASKALASFSGYMGDMVDGVGPGVSILSSVPGGFQAMSGTSMATPHVAGIAALMLSKNPQLTPQRIGDILCQTAEDLGDKGRDSRFGCGFLSAPKALEAVPLPATPVPTPTPGQTGCHIIRSQTQMAGSTAFGVPFNPFDPSEMIMTATCLGNQVAASAGSGKPTNFIFRQGYVFTGGNWQPFAYNSTTAASADWFTEKAVANLSQAYTPGNPTYFLAFVCLRVNNEWKCGCSDQACQQAKWNIQAFK